MTEERLKYLLGRFDDSHDIVKKTFVKKLISDREKLIEACKLLFSLSLPGDVSGENMKEKAVKLYNEVIS